MSDPSDLPVRFIKRSVLACFSLFKIEYWLTESRVDEIGDFFVSPPVNQRPDGLPLVPARIHVLPVSSVSIVVTPPAVVSAASASVSPTPASSSVVMPVMSAMPVSVAFVITVTFTFTGSSRTSSFSGSSRTPGVMTAIVFRFLAFFGFFRFSTFTTFFILTTCVLLSFVVIVVVVVILKFNSWILTKNWNFYRKCITYQH